MSIGGDANPPGHSTRAAQGGLQPPAGSPAVAARPSPAALHHQAMAMRHSAMIPPAAAASSSSTAPAPAAAPHESAGTPGPPAGGSSGKKGRRHSSELVGWSSSKKSRKNSELGGGGSSSTKKGRKNSLLGSFGSKGSSAHAGSPSGGHLPASKSSGATSGVAAVGELGACVNYAALAAHNASVVARVVRLHYVLARLTLDEWLAELPSPEASAMHEPHRVSALIAALLSRSSLDGYAAVPQLYFEDGFGEGGGLRAGVTRALFTYGGPRFGAPNVKDEDLIRRHADGFAGWWCGGQPPSACGGFEAYYSPHADAGRWSVLSPAYLVGSEEWLLGKLNAVLAPDLIRAVAPLSGVWLILRAMTEDAVLATCALAVLSEGLVRRPGCKREGAGHGGAAWLRVRLGCMCVAKRGAARSLDRQSGSAAVAPRRLLEAWWCRPGEGMEGVADR